MQTPQIRRDDCHPFLIWLLSSSSDTFLMISLPILCTSIMVNSLQSQPFTCLSTYSHLECQKPIIYQEGLWRSVTGPVQFSSVAQSCLFASPRTSARQASLSINNSQNLLKLMSIEPVMPTNHLILCIPFSSCLQSFPASAYFPMSQFFA